MALSLNFIGRLGFEARPSLVRKVRKDWRAEGSHHVRREKTTGECRNTRWPSPNRPRAIARQASGGGPPEGSPEDTSEARASHRKCRRAMKQAMAIQGISSYR